MKTSFRTLLFTAFLFPCVSCGHEGDEHGDVAKKIGAVESEIEKLRKVIESRQEHLRAEHEEQKKAFDLKEQSLKMELSAAHAKAQANEKQIADLKAALDAAMEASNADDKKIESLEGELAKSHAALDRLRASVADLTRKIATAGVAKAETATTGSGDYVYQVIPDWPKYPEGKSLGSLHGDVAADSQGRVYISVGGTIQVIGADGVYERDLGEQWGGVHGMKVRKQDGEEFLFVAQNGAKTVAKLKLDGTVVWKIVGPPEVEGMYNDIKEYNPTDVDLAADGTIYIVDGYGKSLVHVYDKDRKYLKTFGGKGEEDGKFNICHNVIIDTRQENPTLLISDRQNNRLQLHAMDGSFIKTIDAELRQPCAADIYGDLLAVGELGGRLSLYDKDNKLVARLGDQPPDRKKGNGAPPDSWVDGALVAVHGCTFDSKGDLYAQEWNRFGRIVKYTRAK